MIQSTPRTRLVALVSISFMLVTNAMAEIPQVISYQGKITDAGGTAVGDDTYTMCFRIYDASSGGTMLWDSGDRSVATSQGVASLLLGESPQPALNLDFSVDYWLLVTFQGADQSPRVRLTSAGYSYMASGLVPGTEVSGSVSGGANAAIKGTNSASDGYGLFGSATSTSGTNYGVFGSSTSPTGSGVCGWASASHGWAFGVTGQSSSTDGKGVFGLVDATTGTTRAVEGWSYSAGGCGVGGFAFASTGGTTGVYGRSDSGSGRGVYGLANATSGVNYGVYGEAFSSGGYAGYFAGNTRVTGNLTVDGTLSGSGIGDITSVNAGTGLTGGATSGDATLSVAVPLALSASNASAIIDVLNTTTSGSAPGLSGQTNSTEGRGVYGIANASTGATYGVYGATISTGGTGVLGHAMATTGTTYGVFGSNPSTNGRGVFGWATATTGDAYGVLGQTASTAGRGVYGVANATAGTTYGVYGQANSPSGYAGYFQGHARVTGNLTVDGTLSGSGIGDITDVTAGTGLDGGAASGNATLSVEVPLALSASNANPIVQGTNMATTNTSPGVKGETSSTGGRGVEGTATATTGQTFAVYGRSYSTGGYGVYGWASASTGGTYGVVGLSNSSSGIGVSGVTTATDGTSIGVKGTSTSTAGCGVSGVATASTGPAYGVSGVSSSTDGYGVYAEATATTGVTSGVRGRSNSTAGNGVVGYAGAASGATVGVYGDSYSSSGYGVYGQASATAGTNCGGRFSSLSSGGTGVYGLVTPSSNADRFGVIGRCFPSDNWGIGVRGEGGYRGVHGVSTHTTASFTTYGVYGEASGAAVNYGVYASGDLGASGTKTAIVRTENGPKAVYCMESTEVWFEDFGRSELRAGRAMVRLNADFLQTVTIDGSHPMMVFITPGADIGRWWVEESTREFQLFAPDSPDGAPFSYRIVAKRAGYEDVRLEARPDAYADHFLYPSISDVPAAHQAEWLKADAVSNERAPERVEDR